MYGSTKPELCITKLTSRDLVVDFGLDLFLQVFLLVSDTYNYISTNSVLPDVTLI